MSHRWKEPRSKSVCPAFDNICPHSQKKFAGNFDIFINIVHSVKGILRLVGVRGALSANGGPLMKGGDPLSNDCRRELPEMIG